MVRGIVWVVVALLFAYAAFELYRGLRGGAAGAGHVPRDNDADFAASEDELNRFVIERAYADRADANAGDDGANDTSPWNEPPPATASPATAGAFKSTLEIEQLRREIAQLQAALASQRREMDEVVDEVRALKAQLEAAAVSQSISPEYNEALVFARRGLDVDTIAERCGISRSEAELVHALAQRRDGDRAQGEGQ
jgi:hypothetical protein